MEKTGIFSLISINNKELELLQDYLRKSQNTAVFDLLKYLVGDRFLELLDILAGENIKIPNRNILFRDIEYIKIYNYVKNHGYSIDAIKNATKIFDKNITFVRGTVLRMAKILMDDYVLDRYEEFEGIKMCDLKDKSDEIIET